MEKVVVSGYGFVRDMGSAYAAIIHVHIDGHVLELQADQQFETKEHAIEYLTENLQTIVNRLCVELGLEIETSQLHTSISSKLH